jgi:hypothetical protein
MAIVGKERHQLHDIFLSKVVFWSSIFVVVVANLLTSFVLVPFLMVLDNIFLYVVVIITALIMGFLYNLLIVDIGHLGRGHHVVAGIIVPLIALANVIGIVFVANALAEAVSIQHEFANPGFIAMIYAVAFIVPYVVDRIRVAGNRRPLLKSHK